jgi:transposase
MSITERKHVSEIGSDTGRRLEIFTGAGRRRSWSVDQKAAIVAQSYDGSASVCDVARRHGLTPSQLFAWRREARLPPDTLASSLFVEAVVDPVIEREEPAQVRPRTSEDGVIEIEIDGIMVRVGRGTEETTITAVLRALKGIS